MGLKYITGLWQRCAKISCHGGVVKAGENGKQISLFRMGMSFFISSFVLTQCAEQCHTFSPYGLVPLQRQPVLSWVEAILDEMAPWVPTAWLRLPGARLQQQDWLYPGAWG